MPGLSIVASSAGEESWFTEQLIEQIEKDGDPNSQLVGPPSDLPGQTWPEALPVVVQGMVWVAISGRTI